MKKGAEQQAKAVSTFSKTEVGSADMGKVR